MPSSAVASCVDSLVYAGSPQVLHDGKMWSSSEDPVPNLITYNLTGMASPDMVACTDAETGHSVGGRGAVWVSCVMCLCR